MNAPDTRLRRRADLEFFGSVMAGQSHEVTNVLNIINELAGLQEDLLLSEEGPDPERLKQLAGRIRSQVMRGEEIIRSMNRFAHSVDHPVTVFDLKETLDHIAYLAGRPARLGKIALETRFPNASLPLENNPFTLEEAVFTCLKMAFDACGERRRVTLEYRLLRGGAEIEVHSDDPLPEGTDVEKRMKSLALLLDELRGSVSARPEVGNRKIAAFFVPAAETPAT